MDKALKFNNNKEYKPSHNISFIDMLLDLGAITVDQLHIAKIEHLKTGKPLDTLLVELGFLSDRLVTEAKAKVGGYLNFNSQKTFLDAKTLENFPRAEAESLKVLPLYYKGNDLHVAVCDPEDLKIFDRLRLFYKDIDRFVIHISTPVELLKAIDDGYSHQVLSLKKLIQTYDDAVPLASQSREKITTHFLHALLIDAIKQQASDIHLEPEEKFVCIRYRIDGVLRQICAFHQQYWSLLCVRLKILSGLNIAESRLPQDGRFSLNVSGREVDLRVSTLPTKHGENIVIRILDKHYSLRSLEDLGLTVEQKEQVIDILKTPEGIFIVTGPTGSGKTTTLYSMLRYLSVSSVNIMTLEDPLEYDLPHVRQVEIQEHGGITFSEGVRAILRQDPDIIFIGEIRDISTAQMAVRASMTGHLVFSTFHTQDVFGVFPRLFDLGITPRLLEGNIKGILAQRLLRRLCNNCKKRTIVDNHIVFMAKGCEVCSYAGYLGRTAVAEILCINEEIEVLIQRQASTAELRKFAQKQGFQPLRKAAFEKVYKGETSLEELYRILGKP
jgi:type II secretory ATPase GspE/PulE/Tfp pilus assembly ATPase PilB-like protein